MEKMQDTTEALPIPELTKEQKLRVVLTQRQILSLQLEIYAKQKQLEQMTPVLHATLNGIATELNADPAKFTFDLDNLILVLNK